MKKIKALFIFEILGNPPDYIKTALDGFIDNLGKIKGVHIINKKVHEPKIIEGEKNKGFYTTFGEVEIETDNLSTLFGVTFHMLPSHVEIIEPEELKLSNFELSPIITELAVRLHKYDEVAKTLLLDKENLIAQIRQMQNNSNNPHVITVTRDDRNPATITKADVKNIKKEKSAKKKKKR